MTEEIKSRLEQIRAGKVPKGYRQSPSGVIPRDWHDAKMSDVTEEIKETAGDKEYETLSISAGVGFVNQAKKFGREMSGAQYSKYTVLRYGDFSYNKGNSNLYPQGCIYRLHDREEAAVPNVFESFRFDSLNGDYYEQLFVSGYLNKQLYSKINRGVRDDGLLNLTGRDFYGCYLPVPPLPEQRKIAEILMQCDKVIAIKKERIEEEKKRKKWLMKKLLYPNSNKKGEDIKANWKHRAVGSVTTSFSGGTPKSSSPIYYSSNGIPFIRSGEIGAEKTELFLSMAGLENSAAKMVFKGDLLYALYGANSGECFISKMDGAINQAILCLRSSTVDIQFLFYLLFDNKERIISTYLQGGQGNLSGELVKKIVFSFPDKSIQKSVSQIILAEDKVICSLENEQIVWQQKKKALMQLLLTGIVQVNA